MKVVKGNWDPSQKRNDLIGFLEGVIKDLKEGHEDVEGCNSAILILSEEILHKNGEGALIMKSHNMDVADSVFFLELIKNRILLSV